MPNRAPTHKPLTRIARVHLGTQAYTAAQRGYDSKWQRARVGWLAAHPLCVMCAQAGRVTAATVVDHIKPHRLAWALDSGIADAVAAARALFWDRRNWQSLCKTHHDSTKQATERAEVHRVGGIKSLAGRPP
ncbi:MAG TPA: HNH endonuclease signature motif containing protein [Stenotrophobium sp.]|nr:HNH endonuclease signature motif containing protein [Stenotrophobium sp.]